MEQNKAKRKFKIFSVKNMKKGDKNKIYGATMNS